MERNTFRPSLNGSDVWQLKTSSLAKLSNPAIEHDGSALALQPKSQVIPSPSSRRSEKQHEMRRRRYLNETHHRSSKGSQHAGALVADDIQLGPTPHHAGKSSRKKSMPSSSHMLTNYNHNLEENPWRWPEAEKLEHKADFDTSSDSEIEAELQSQEELSKASLDRAQSLSSERIHYTISRTDDWLSLACSSTDPHTKSHETDSDLLDAESLSQNQESAPLSLMSQWVDTIKKEQQEVASQRVDYQDLLSRIRRRGPTGMSAQDFADLADYEDNIARTKEGTGT